MFDFLRPYIPLVALVLIVAVGWGVWSISQVVSTPTYSEIKELEGQKLSFDEYATFFETIAREKGGAHAFQALLRADIAPGTDLHLLGHVVGDILYKQEGINGIYECTPDFRNACSHSIVVGLFDERGQDALDDIARVCRNAPGGEGAYTMCFHGLGHGILAFSNYDFEQAVTMCQKTGTPEKHDREYMECVGGATMEMIAGVHDRNSWELQVANYFKPEDPLSPCNLSFMPEEVAPICYTYLTPHLFEAAGGDLGNLSPDIYPKAFAYCDAIPKEKKAERDSCFGGFGKEFVVLAQGRDVRDIGSMEEPALKNIQTWCASANDYIGELVCNGNALEALFWGGENNPDASFAFCPLQTNERLQQECYIQLAHMIPFYLSNNKSEGVALCERLPSPHREYCSKNI